MTHFFVLTVALAACSSDVDTMDGPGGAGGQTTSQGGSGGTDGAGGTQSTGGMSTGGMMGPGPGSGGMMGPGPGSGGMMGPGPGSGGMMGPGPGSGGGGPMSCTDEGDCVDACPPDSIGCTCADTPMGMRCIPTCNTSDDCPDPPMVDLMCNQDGLCVPTM